ncbi:hypothetical protein GMORB2_7591 [Geosmithia morbida]|uniref:Macro domain-like protein n=1 Tax=Geosmithia morbida TaxID=1094350 RepID=A0A9P5CZU7_9HYPO|nr:uncharacterized protein GMORB2_7591 [Geosmithia morbida]KAF4121998.1 hypothetical protein GMORB2_7591 [Geosmithia morbida]
MPIPHIHLLCIDKVFIEAFSVARTRHGLPPSVQVTVHHCSLSQLPASVQFDTIVSPANSYGRLDGAFDDAISRAISPVDDYLALTRVAQQALYVEWRGFAPPGSCTLVDLPEEFAAAGQSRNVWGVRRLALCPTMRMPEDVRWDREVVYKCVWSLLCAVGKRSGGDEVRSLLMTPLGTGVGRISPDRWAGQLVLAIKHSVDADENPDVWSSLSWEDSSKTTIEVQKTWMGEGLSRS